MPDFSSEPCGLLRVLGVDPAAVGATGYGVVESDGRGFRMLRFGALRAARSPRPDEFPDRLRQIHALVTSLIEEFQPHGLALESVFTALNMKTALKLAEVRGVILLAAAQCRLPAYSYSPREVKACVSGYGHADKLQMQLMVRAVLGMSETPEPADAADALAVALCHLQAARSRALFAASTELAGNSSPSRRARRTASARRGSSPAGVPALR